MQETHAQMLDRLVKEHAAAPREDRLVHLISAWQQMGYSDSQLRKMLAAAR